VEVSVAASEPLPPPPPPPDLAAERAAVRKELLADSIAQLVGLYSIVMACLLLLFVEQTCAPNERNPEPHACTLQEDFESRYERAVLGVNFACLAIFVVAQGIFWLREKFMCVDLRMRRTRCAC
jgi:hypothetical protein